jgi:hypothetical protein
VKLVILGGLVAAALVPVPAEAVPLYDFRGGCTGQFQGMRSPGGVDWRGIWDVEIVATDSSANRLPTPTASVRDVACEFVVDGVSQGWVLTAPDSTGSTANGVRDDFTTPEDARLTLCTHVTVGGEMMNKCRDGEVTRFPPPVLGQSVVYTVRFAQPD